LYGAAVIETTAAQLSKKLDEAETAISLRLQQLGSSQKAATPEADNKSRARSLTTDYVQRHTERKD
jgi:hypothetical protein